MVAVGATQQLPMLKLQVDTHKADDFISSTTSMKTKKGKGREESSDPQEKNEEK